jgi:hypothetical protein
MSADVQRMLSIDPDARHVEFRANACRECDESGPLTQVDNPAWWQWFDEHRDKTGHTKFYQLKIERSTGESTSVSAPPRKRRTLGQR